MPAVTSHAPGTPSWFDVTSPDIPATNAFYAGLFGWEAQDQGEEAGHYTMYTLDGRQVGAGTPLFEGHRPMWQVYVTVTDADATAKVVAEAGGSTYMEPFDVMDVGRMAVFGDPTGAAIYVWQPRRHIGAEVVGEPGAFCWAELASRDLGAAMAFYSTVFGWGVHEGAEYSEFQLDGQSVAGLMAMPPEVPAEVPSYWMPYVAVSDVDATTAKAQSLGGSVTVVPKDIEPGRFSIISDPFGAMLGLITFTH